MTDRVVAYILGKEREENVRIANEELARNNAAMERLRAAEIDLRQASLNFERNKFMVDSMHRMREYHQRERFHNMDDQTRRQMAREQLLAQWRLGVAERALRRELEQDKNRKDVQLALLKYKSDLASISERYNSARLKHLAEMRAAEVSDLSNRRMVGVQYAKIAEDRRHNLAAEVEATDARNDRARLSERDQDLRSISSAMRNVSNERIAGWNIGTKIAEAVGKYFKFK
jgi:hypothetical protein